MQGSPLAFTFEDNLRGEQVKRLDELHDSEGTILVHMSTQQAERAEERGDVQLAYDGPRFAVVGRSGRTLALRRVA